MSGNCPLPVFQPSATRSGPFSHERCQQAAKHQAVSAADAPLEEMCRKWPKNMWKCAVPPARKWSPNWDNFARFYEYSNPIDSAAPTFCESWALILAQLYNHQCRDATLNHILAKGEMLWDMAPITHWAVEGAPLTTKWMMRLLWNQVIKSCKCCQSSWPSIHTPQPHRTSAPSCPDAAAPFAPAVPCPTWAPASTRSLRLLLASLPSPLPTPPL